MKLAKKSLPPETEGDTGYRPWNGVPKCYEGQPEIPNPGPKQYWCPSCGELVWTEAFPDGRYWHYRVICPDCKAGFSECYKRFTLPPKQKLPEKESKVAEPDPEWIER